MVYGHGAMENTTLWGNIVGIHGGGAGSIPDGFQEKSKPNGVIMRDTLGLSEVYLDGGSCSMGGGLGVGTMLLVSLAGGGLISPCLPERE